MEAYEAFWPIGSRQRTAYALALWLGNRVSDVTRLEWSMLTTKTLTLDGNVISVDGFELVQFKGRKRGKQLFLPMTAMLEAELAGLESALRESSGASVESVIAAQVGDPDLRRKLLARLQGTCCKRMVRTY